MPSVLSVVTLNIGSASPGALAITVPSGAQGVVVLLRGQFDAFTVSSSFSSSFTITPSGGAAPVVVATAQVSATGSQTITPSYGSYIAEGAAFFVAFVDGIDNTSTATWVRAVAASSSSSQTIASTTTDLVLAMDNWYTGDTAARFRAFSSSGALTGQGSAIAGSAARVAGPVSHATTGVLVGSGSQINGSAARTGPAVTHDTSGALVGQGSIITGVANEPETLSAGFLWMLRRQREMEEALRNVPEPVAEVIKAEAPRVIEKPKAQARNELRRALEQENLPYRAAYTQALERLVQQLRQEQEDDEEEEAIAEALLYVL